jgi:Skp family chaperone for outer membrane proteins
MELAVVNITRLLDQSKRGQGLSDELRAVAEGWQAKITEVEVKLKKAQERLNHQGPSASVEQLFSLQREVRMAELEASGLQQRQRADVEAHRDFFRTQVMNEVRPLLSIIAKEKKLDLVLAMTDDAPAFVAPSIDVTALVIERLDA